MVFIGEVTYLMWYLDNPRAFWPCTDSNAADTFKAQKGRLLHWQHHMHVSWFSRECVAKIDKEEKKLLNKVFIFVFFVHKKYSRSFIKLRLNHWCHMDYFNDVLTTFRGLEHVRCCLRRVRKLSDFIKNILRCVKMNWRWKKVLRVWNDMRMSN